MDVTTDRTYQATLAGNANSPAIISVPNAQGPEAADVTVSCVVQQSGSGDPSPTNVREISGREIVTVLACGKNLFNANDQIFELNSMTGPDANGWMFAIKNNSSGNKTYYMNFYTEISRALRPNTEYLIVCEIAQADISGNVGFYVISNGPLPSDAHNQFTSNWHIPLEESVGVHSVVLTTRSNYDDAVTMLRSFISFYPGSSGTIKFRLSVLEDTSVTPETFVYDPYRDMGGGTIKPASPLYGLPGAEDTVKVNTAGNVTVTRRTGCIALDGTESWIRGIKNSDGYYWRLPVNGILEITSSVIPNIICSNYMTVDASLQWGSPINSISQNFNPGSRTEILIYDTRYAQSEISEWKSYLAAQKSAGTPVTVVYELAAPTAETPAAITPITPDSGILNICTDGDEIEATLNLSGWDTIG